MVAETKPKDTQIFVNFFCDNIAIIILCCLATVSPKSMNSRNSEGNLFISSVD